jgi:hypothetical protein
MAAAVESSACVGDTTTVEPTGYLLTHHQTALETNITISRAYRLPSYPSSDCVGDKTSPLAGLAGYLLTPH